MKDGEKVVNQSGGSQSFVSARFDCIPPVVLRLLAQCLGFGARRYGDENWKKIPIEDHLNHAMNHINEWRAGDRSEPHLVNAMARITFAFWQAVDSGQQEGRYINPSEKRQGDDAWEEIWDDAWDYAFKAAEVWESKRRASHQACGHRFKDNLYNVEVVISPSGKIYVDSDPPKKPFRKVGEWCEPPIDPMQSGGGWHPGCIGYVNQPYVNASVSGKPWYHKTGAWGHSAEIITDHDHRSDESR